MLGQAPLRAGFLGLIRQIVFKLHLPPFPLHMQASMRKYKYAALGWDRTTRKCCGAAHWATQRIAASYHALEDFYEQVAQQVGIGGTGACCGCCACATCSRLAA